MSDRTERAAADANLYDEAHAVKWLFAEKPMSIESQIVEYVRVLAEQMPAGTARSLVHIDTQTIAGDDCTVIDLPGEFDLVVGTDFVRGAGFRLFKLGKLSFKDIGYYLAAANASDLAAMGARPVGFLDVLRYSKDMEFQQAKEILDGIHEACVEFCMPLVGGDSGGYELPVLSGTAFGLCKKGTALLRRNGTPGDYVYLSGSTGVAGAADAYFSNSCDGQLSHKDEEALLAAWRRPRPQLVLGQFLSENGFSRCAMDTSDGLRASIEQLSRASGLAMEVNLTDVPVSDLVRKVAKIRGFRDDDIYDLVFSDSVDFRLLFTVSPAVSASYEKNARASGFEIHRVGRLTDKSEPCTPIVRSATGKETPLPGIAWDQSETPTYARLEAQIKRRKSEND